MSRHTFSPRTALGALAALLALGAVAPSACADGNRRSTFVPPPPKYTQECGACHIAYPAGMLPAASWQRLMGDLTRHFGTDASLDAATTAELAAWLAANAGTYRRVREQPPQDRISRADWFVRKHDEVSPATWKLPAVKSAANCSACHPKADQGDFDEHRVRIPR
jgi:Dihaem cytochrome c